MFYAYIKKKDIFYYIFYLILFNSDNHINNISEIRIML